MSLVRSFGSAVSHADLILASLRLGATYLGAASQATNAIALTLIAICYQLPFSISQAISIRVGNLLGADLPQHAKIASKAAQLFAFLSIAPVAILLQVFRHSFVRLFSSDPEVISLFDRMVSSHAGSIRDYSVILAHSLGSSLRPHFQTVCKVR